MKCRICEFEMPDEFRYCPICGTMKPDKLARPTGMKLKELYAVWCAANYPRLSASSIGNYRRAWNRVAPDYSDRDIGEIRTEELQHIANRVSYNDAKKFRSLLNNMYKLAANGQPIKSPSEDVVLPKRVYQRRNAFKSYEIAKIWQAYREGDRDAAYALVMIYTGMRTGEFISAKEKNIDFALKIITDVATKNEKCALQPIIIPRILVPVLQSLCIGDPEHPLIDVSRESFYRRYYSFLQRIQVRPLAPYCCRHTCATLLARKNVSLAITQRVMRHADCRTTIDVYTHICLDEDHAAMDSLEEE